MGRQIFLLIMSLLTAAPALASEKAALVLSGHVPERIDVTVVQDSRTGKWTLSQTSNGNLQAILIKDTRLGPIVSIRAP